MKSVKMTTSNGAAAAMIPAVGHTQRATIDCERNEIHVMTVSKECISLALQGSIQLTN